MDCFQDSSLTVNGQDLFAVIRWVRILSKISRNSEVLEPSILLFGSGPAISVPAEEGAEEKADKPDRWFIA